MSDVMIRTEGSRTERRRTRKRRRVAGRAFVFMLVAALLAGGVYLVSQREPAAPDPLLGDAGDGEQLTLLVATTLHDDPSQQADSLTLFGIDRSGDDPVGLFIPAGTFGVIPGQSSIESVGKALTFGRARLQETTVENLLGILVDHTVVLTDVAMAQIVEGVAGVDVEVAEELYENDAAGRRTLVFELGQTHMNGAQAVTYMTYKGEGETELDRFVRAQKVWEALLLEPGPELAAAIAGADALDDADADALATLLGAMASADADERTFDVLPVKTVGSGGLDEVYSLEPGELSGAMDAHFSASLQPGVADPGDRPRVEVRNGVGVPGIGGDVAAMIVPAGFKVEVTGNTESFGYRSTQIVVYGEDDASMELGRRVRALLGTGEVVRGTRGQTVVDVTIVVGQDLVNEEG